MLAEFAIECKWAGYSHARLQARFAEANKKKDR
jgi:hypothetical protein